MAVPGSGSLSLAAIAAEKLENDYTDVDTSYGPYSLRDITVGGATTVNGEDYDFTNGFSPSHPDNSPGYSMGEFYSYDHDYAAPACNLAYETGGQGTFDFPINLGSGTGTVTIEYQAYTAPDKFTFTWNGNTYTSGDGNGTGNSFVGGSQYANNSAVQPLDTLTGSYGTSGSQAQYGGRGTITFSKNSSTSSSNMRIDAPLTGTGWWFSVSCPGNQVIGGGDGIAPTISAGVLTTVGSSVIMNGNVTDLGTTSNFTTTGTISQKGFVYLPGVTTLINFYRDTPSGTFTADVVEVLEDDSTINTTGNFNESAVVASTGGTVTTQDATSVTETAFVANYTPTSLGGVPISFRAFAKNAAGTTYSSVINSSTPGNIDEIGVTYCNSAFSQTPTAQISSTVIADTTGNDYQKNNSYNGTSTSAITQTVTENTVSLTSSNTYVYRAAARQGTTLIYGNIKSFTVPASYDFSATITVRSDQIYSTMAYGYGSSLNYFPTMGSMTNYTFNSKTITGVYFQDQSGTDYLYITFSTAKPSFSNLVINGTSYGASSTWTSSGTTGWRKTVTSNPMGTTYGFATLNMSI
jgi:hypothetical protein